MSNFILVLQKKRLPESAESLCIFLYEKKLICHCLSGLSVDEVSIDMSSCKTAW